MELNELEDSLQESIECYNNCVTGSNERKAEAENIEKLSRALVALRQQEADEVDKDERRRIEEEKNKENAVIERKKSGTPWLRIVLEALAQGGVKFLGHMLYKDELREVLHFEEHGIIRSKGGKDLKPPRHD